MICDKKMTFADCIILILVQLGLTYIDPVNYETKLEHVPLGSHSYVLKGEHGSKPVKRELFLHVKELVLTDK